MPRPKSAEPMTLTTIYLPIRFIEWIKEHEYKVATFVREAVEEKIEKESGYDEMIRKTEEKISELQRALKNAQDKLVRLRREKVEFEEKERIAKLRERISTAILNIPYRDELECARDLRELGKDMEWEEWRDLVKSVWDEMRIDGDRA